MQHRQLLGIAPRQFVDQVEGEIEALDILEADGNGRPAVIFLHVDVVAPDAVGVVADKAGRLVLDQLRVLELRDRLAGRVEDDGVEDAVPAAHSDHPVRRAAVVIDAVTGAEDLAVLADLHLEASLHDDVALLPVVLGQVDRAVLRLLVVDAAHIERLRDPVLEGIGQVVVGHAVRAGDLLAAAGPGQRVGAQVRAVPLEDIRDGYLERQCAPVNEGKVQIVPAFFAVQIFLH